MFLTKGLTPTEATAELGGPEGQSDKSSIEDRDRGLSAIRQYSLSMAFLSPQL